MGDVMRERLTLALGHMRIRALVPDHGCGGDEEACIQTCPVAVEVGEDEVIDALMPVVADLVAEARAAGAAEVRERVEAVLDEAEPALSGTPLDCNNACWYDVCTCTRKPNVLAWRLDKEAIRNALGGTP